ncbi:fungal-specific transcription factor domain-containing protein [Mycena sp. CBHHK59/15]|nr:fungal-specific transcription factor domain-containing protein [Mycena sp. CBHHK59/15]
MSCDDEAEVLHGSPSDFQKKRRIQRSCDICRKRKSDSVNGIDGRCTNCIAFNASCTYVGPARKRGPKNRLVEELQQKNAALEAKLRDVSICSLCTRSLKPQLDGSNSSSSLSIFPHSSSHTDTMASPEHEHIEDDPSFEELTERFKGFSIHPLKNKFLALLVKEEYLGRPIVTHCRRQEFWTRLPASSWEKEIYDERPPPYVYPAGDLVASLLDLYFTNVQPIIPLLHRPSFERSVAEGLHLRDAQFGATLLAVLAVASRLSDDPRVFVVGETSSLSSGWKFFHQVLVRRKFVFDDPSIYEVQLFCLSSLFTLGTSTPQASWAYLGLGIRFIQQRGEHRRKRRDNRSTLEKELWKRAFWSLFSMDTLVCAFLGRPSALHNEDYDVEMPLEIDDEFLEHPDAEEAFKQPLGNPSLLTYFTFHIRLSEILGATLRRLYASTKTKSFMGWIGAEWEQRAVAELDSSMNDFLDSLPPHLRWDPERKGVFFEQSAVLHTMYYSILITIHRPFIHKSTVLASPSLAICTSAARSAISVVDVWFNRMQRQALPYMHNAVFLSGVVLVLNLFGAKRAGLPIDTDKELAHISTAMKFLKFAESRWQTAGRVWELLQELQSWDGPRPSRTAPNCELHPANMRPPAVPPVGSMSAETSMFTESKTAPATSGDFFTVTNELSQRQTRSSGQEPENFWNGMLSSNPTLHGSIAGTLPPAALQYSPVGTGGYVPMTFAPNDWSSGVTEVPNMTIDEDLMSVWMAAPADFGNLAAWDAYIENSKETGFNWLNDFSVPQQ